MRSPFKIVEKWSHDLLNIASSKNVHHLHLRVMFPTQFATYFRIHHGLYKLNIYMMFFVLCRYIYLTYLYISHVLYHIIPLFKSICKWHEMMMMLVWIRIMAKASFLQQNRTRAIPFWHTALLILVHNNKRALFVPLLSKPILLTFAYVYIHFCFSINFIQVYSMCLVQKDFQRLILI